MSDHYYTNQPEAPHNMDLWHFALLGEMFSFTTDSGVFSKKTVDYGSRVLLTKWYESFEHGESELPEGTLLDVGCGYGPIGLALAKKTGRKVEMIDINERAVSLAKMNAEKNGVTDADIHVSNLYEELHQNAYAAIISNPPIRAGKKVVHEILQGAYDLLQNGGTLTIVIQKKQGAPSAKSKMAECFGNVCVLGKDKGYYILQSTKEA